MLGQHLYLIQHRIAGIFAGALLSTGLNRFQALCNESTDLTLKLQAWDWNQAANLSFMSFPDRGACVRLPCFGAHWPRLRAPGQQPVAGGTRNAKPPGHRWQRGGLERSQIDHRFHPQNRDPFGVPKGLKDTLRSVPMS